jgi:membrane protein
LTRDTYNAFFALFPLLLVVVTVLGFLLGRDSGFQQRLLGSAVADFPRRRPALHLAPG